MGAAHDRNSSVRSFDLSWSRPRRLTVYYILCGTESSLSLMTFWTWAKVKCPLSLSSDDDVEALLALHRALRSSSTARVANVSRGSLCLRAPARSLASQKSARTARSLHCRKSRTTATPVTTEPCTSSHRHSQKKGWAPAQARSAALSRVYPYSPSSTGSRTSVACHPPSPVSYAHTH